MSKPSVSNELMRLAELRDKGVITEEEFQQQKAKILQNDDSAPLSAERGKDDGQPAAPNIVIQQSSAATSSAVAVAKSSGCLGTVLKIIGAMVVSLFILSMCIAEDKNKETNNSTELEASGVDSQQTSEALILEAEVDFKEADDRLSKVWTDMNPAVREHLKKEQIAWNRSKESSCKQTSKDNATSADEEVIFNFECLTGWTNERTAELVNKEKELLPKVLAAEKKEAEANLKAATDNAKAVLAAIPQEVANQIQGDLDSWGKAADNRCNLESSRHLNDTQAEIAALKCVSREIIEKTKELQGYAI